MKAAFLTVCLLMSCGVSVSLAQDEHAGRVPADVGAEDEAAASGKPLVQMAILLDTSNSMDGLIDQARSQIWKVVNELATTKRDGQPPALQVALYEYGNDSIDPGEGHVRQVLALTDDLDAVSEKLFALQTNGGSEFCGQAIQSAVDGLQWSDARGAYKTIFIAGNEPFSQGKVDYRKACQDAIARGIMVNTIHCGDEQTGIQSGWRDGATLADGAFMCIDQNQAIVAIAAPQDAKIAELSGALNGTYIAYGAAGEALASRQVAQDLAATAQPAAAAAGAPVQRALAKSSALYTNSTWDLVDAMNDGTVKLEDVNDEDLPAEMRELSIKERKAYVEEHARKRMEIQKEIQSLNTEREKFVASKRQELGETSSNTLDTAMVNAVKEQFEKRSAE